MTIPPEMSSLFTPRPPGPPPADAAGMLLPAPVSEAAGSLRSAGRFAAFVSAATLAALFLLLSVGGMGARVVASDAGRKQAWMVALAVVAVLGVAHALLTYAGIVAASGRTRYARMAFVGGDLATILKAMALDARRLRVMTAIAFGLALVAVITASIESDAWSWVAMLRPLLFEAQREDGARVVAAVLWLSMAGSAWAAWAAVGAAAEVAAATTGRDGVAGFEVVVAPIADAAPAGTSVPPVLPTMPRPARHAAATLLAGEPADPWRAVLGVLFVAILGMLTVPLWQSYAVARVLTDGEGRRLVFDLLTVTKDSEGYANSYYPGRPEPKRDSVAVVGAAASLGGHVVLFVLQAWLVVWAATCVFAGPRLRRLSVFLAWAMLLAVAAVAVGSAILSTRPAIQLLEDMDIAYRVGRRGIRAPALLYMMATERLETKTAWRALLPAAVVLTLTRWPVRAMFEQARNRRG